MTWLTGLLTAGVAALVSGAVSYLFNRQELLHKLQAEYEQEQKRELRELIGKYHGPLVHAANSLNYRMWNLYRHYDRGWLDVEGDYSADKYYFASFVYRFLGFFTLVRQFEAEAIVLDQRIAEDKDYLFLNFAAAFHWCMTDTALFDGLEYDSFLETDHFFSDTFRSYCSVLDPDSNFPDFYSFADEHLEEPGRLRSVLEFFDGLSKGEDRYRWDRLVALHLLLLAFINEFGRASEQTSEEKIKRVTGQAENQEVLDNLVSWLPRHGLDKSDEISMVQRAIKSNRSVRRPSQHAEPRR